MQDIVLEKVSKAFNGKVVLKDFSAVFPAGKISCIMAPSGAGKTTLLRILMGLDKQDAGTISGLDGLRRSSVFQENRLCEYMTPVDNIRLVTPSLNRDLVLEAMTAIGLYECANQPCRELSGGMRRRVALLRALMADYDVLFLDEPFKELDEEMKAVVLRDTAKRCAGRTVLLVTHDAAEADALAVDRIIEMPYSI